MGHEYFWLAQAELLIGLFLVSVSFGKLVSNFVVAIRFQGYLGRTDIQIMSVISAASQMKPAKFAGFFS